MDFSDEWRFRWPTTNSSHAPPLFPRSAASSTIGPLQLRPTPSTLNLFLTSQSLSPPSLPPLPSLSLPKFLQTSSTVLPSTSVAIAAELPSDNLPSPASSFSNSRLEPLLCPDGRSALAFFPTGDNLDRVGFVILTVTDSELRLKGDVLLSSNSFGHRIVQLAACEDADDDCVGFLMASTLYSVHWFRVSLAAQGTKHECPVLVYLGNKLFKSSAVAHVCWSPHLLEESLVLLQSGQLFLFDVNASFKGKRVPVSWDKHGNSVNDGGWLGCEFSWHPRIMVVANYDAVFQVDFRFGKSSVKCLMKIGLLSETDAVESDKFVAFSKAGSDGFHYVVASKRWLILIDIRMPCKPVLQWMHNHQDPSHVSVFSLSTLRGNLGHDGFNRASKMGHGIVLGSFWTGEFSLFCYGPSLSSSNETIEVSDSVYAWDLPSELSLSGLDCPCSNCFMQEEFAKDELPEWVDWQHKKEMALGYIVLDKALYSLLSEANGDDGAGFMLVRLMSSGKLESQKYNACFDMPKKVEYAHVGSTLDAKDFHLCSSEEYKFQGKFKYFRLENLYSYMVNSHSVVKRESPDALRVKRELCIFRPDNANDSLHTSFLDDVCKLADSARYTTMVANVADGGSELFDDHCLIDLKFEDSMEWNIGSTEMRDYAVLNAHFKKQQQRFRPYADICEQLKK